MNNRNCSFWVMVLGLISWAMFCSCATPTAEVSQVGDHEAVKQVPCIVFLPVETELHDAAAQDYALAAELERGATYMDTVIAERLIGRDHVRILSSRQLTSLIPEENGARNTLIGRVAEQLKCNAVMVVTLSQFRQRVGGEYGVDKPAAVSFTMKLYDVRRGTVLWSTMFSESQQSLMSNMMSLKTAFKRGLKWVTAEEMVAQGIQDKIKECPYL